MDNSFVPIIQSHRAELKAALKSANQQAMKKPGFRFAVFIDSDARISVLSKADSAADFDCADIRVGSFCYSEASAAASADPEQAAQIADAQNYDAIIDNCVMILKHFH